MGSGKEHGLVLRNHISNALLLAIAFGLMSDAAVEYFGHLSKSLGEALVIALVVIYVVEYQSHKRLEESALQMITKIGKNIFGLVYGHELPSPFMEALEKTMLEQPVYRERMHIAAQLSSTELKNNDGEIEWLCKLSCTYTFNLINCSDAPAAQPITVFLERDKWLAERFPENSSEPELEYLRIGNTLYIDADNEQRIRRQLSATNLDAKPIANLVFSSDNGNELVLKEPNVVIPANGSVQIQFGGVLYKRYSDNEVWSTSYPTLGVSLDVTSVDFEVEARFPSSGAMLSTNLGDVTSRWSYDSPLLAGQSVIYWWRPKKR